MRNADKNIHTEEHFNEYAGGMIDDFVRSFTGNRYYTIPVEEADEDICVEEGWSFVITDEGMAIIDRYKRRLEKVFDNLFPDGYYSPEIYSYNDY